MRERLPDLVAGSDILSRPDNRTVQVPVKFMEHYRFRLRDPSRALEGAGQGQAEPRRRPAPRPAGAPRPGPGGRRRGGRRGHLRPRVPRRRHPRLALG
ncbi:MAG: hypothetical protein U5L11_15805 [Arhodomonas sp.]|nr:hypothetical protein [Arhodomonas sp.]